MLALGWGLPGVALGTAIPMILFNNVLQPAYTCRKIGMGAAAYAGGTTLRWLPAAAVLAGVAWALRVWIPAVGWGDFWLKAGLLALAAVPVGYLCILGPVERRWIARALRRRSPTAPSMAAAVEGQAAR